MNRQRKNRLLGWEYYLIFILLFCKYIYFKYYGIYKLNICTTYKQNIT